MTKHLTQKQATELWTARIKEMQASMRKDMETKATYDGGEKYKEGPTGKQEAKKGLYFYVNRAKKRGTSRPKDHPDAPTAQDWKNAAKTAKEGSQNEDAAMDKARADFFKRGGKIKKLPDGPKYGHLDTNLAKGVKGLVKNTSKLGLKNRGRHLDTSTPVHKEELGMTAASAGIPHDTKNMGPRDVTDKRYKKDKPPVIKRGFKSYIGM